MTEELIENDNFSAFLWVFITLILGALLRHLNKKFKVPYTPSLLFVGLLWGYFYAYLGIIGRAASYMSAINPVIYI